MEHYRTFNFSAPKAEPPLPRSTYQIRWCATDLSPEESIAALCDIYGADSCLTWLTEGAKVDSASVCRKSAENGFSIGTIQEAIRGFAYGMKPLVNEKAKAYATAHQMVSSANPDKTQAEIASLLASIGITRY